MNCERNQTGSSHEWSPNKRWNEGNRKRFMPSTAEVPSKQWLWTIPMWEWSLIRLALVDVTDIISEMYSLKIQEQSFPSTKGGIIALLARNKGKTCLVILLGLLRGVSSPLFAVRYFQIWIEWCIWFFDDNWSCITWKDWHFQLRYFFVFGSLEDKDYESLLFWTMVGTLMVGVYNFFGQLISVNDWLYLTNWKWHNQSSATDLSISCWNSDERPTRLQSSIASPSTDGILWSWIDLSFSLRCSACSTTTIVHVGESITVSLTWYSTKVIHDIDAGQQTGHCDRWSLRMHRYTRYDIRCFWSRWIRKNSLLWTIIPQHKFKIGLFYLVSFMSILLICEKFSDRAYKAVVNADKSGEVGGAMIS